MQFEGCEGLVTTEPRDIQRTRTQVTEEMTVTPSPTKQKNVNRSFWKTLTASDASHFGGMSIPRRDAEACLPSLDYNKNPPCQMLVAKDLQGQEWTFRHVYRGHPRRHLLTNDWNVFVSQKRLVAGDIVIFLRGEKGELRVGWRKAAKQMPQARSTPSSSADLRLDALAADAATEMSRCNVISDPGSVVNYDVDNVKASI